MEERIREEYRPIPNYKDYEISNLGKVRSLKQGSHGRILKPTHDRKNYLRVALSNCDGVQRFFVHRLVAMSFIPNPYSLPIVNHKDNNPSNNTVGNLEWATQKKNMEYANSQGRLPKGEEKISSKLNDEQVREIASKVDTQSINKLAKEFGVSTTTVYNIKKRLIWQHVI